jgi:hypothetical protein
MLLTEVGIPAVQITGNSSDSDMLGNEVNSIRHVPVFALAFLRSYLYIASSSEAESN